MEKKLEIKKARAIVRLYSKTLFTTKKQYNIFLYENQLEELRKLKNEIQEETGFIIPVTTMIRTGIDEHIRKLKRNLHLNPEKKHYFDVSSKF